MNATCPPELLKGRAYRLFFAEYGERLNHAASKIEFGISNEDKNDLKGRFHMLKGSAGFFGFEEIYRIAAELEIIFANPIELNQAELECAQQKLEELQDFQLRIPQPQGES